MKIARKLSFPHPTLRLGISLDKIKPAQFHEKHIVAYNPKHLFSYGFVNPKGSTLNVWLFVRAIIMCSVATLASLFRCEDTPSDYAFCFPILSDSQGLIFASLVAFLLGLFVSSTFSRWWSTREKLGVIMNNTSSLTLSMINFLPSDPVSQENGKILLRWMHLAHYLVYKQANSDYSFADLVNSEIATKEEAERLRGSIEVSLPGLVYGWCMNVMKNIIVDSHLSPAIVVSTTLANITNCFNASQELAAFLQTQIPYAYLHLLTITAKIHLAFIVFYGGGIIAGGIDNEQWTRILFGYVVIIANNIIYEGLLHIHSMLSNPLGDDSGDFPTHLYIRDTIAMCDAFATPPPVAPVEIEKDVNPND